MDLDVKRSKTQEYLQDGIRDSDFDDLAEITTICPRLFSPWITIFGNTDPANKIAIAAFVTEVVDANWVPRMFYRDPAQL